MSENPGRSSDLLQSFRNSALRQAKSADAFKEIVDEVKDSIERKVSEKEAEFDITDLIKNINTQSQSFECRVKFHDVGTVQHIGNGVATLSGLQSVRTDELVLFPTGVQGLALNLERDSVDVILLGADENIRGGDLVLATGNRLRVPVGTKLLGRVINPLGAPLDGKGDIRAADFQYLERNAPGIVERAPIDEPLQMGNKLIDALLPIGKGQRELIVGDRQTGKTSLAIDAILNQRESEVDCVYVAIGQKKSSTLAVIETLQEFGALSYTTIVMSSSDDPPAMRYLAPYAGCTIAEYFLGLGRNVLIIYDDLSKHADSYRELSLLLRRPPGREAYPGDIFYLHSRLLERACKLNDAEGGGSLTALPIVEVQRGNISAYVPTNLISITDGQIILDRNLFNSGIKPAIDIGRSVSRVGGAAQIKAMRSVSGDLRLQLAQYEEVAQFSRFGTELDLATQRQIERGKRLQQLLIQGVHKPISVELQVVILFCAVNGFLEDIPVNDIQKFEKYLVSYFMSKEPIILADIHHIKDINDDIREDLLVILSKLRDDWLGGKKRL